MVSPSILDRLIGEIVDEDETIGKTACICSERFRSSASDGS